MIVGFIGWGIQLTSGLLTTTDMTDIFLWGLMTAMFAFMVGFGAGAQLVAGTLYLWGSDESKTCAYGNSYRCATPVVSLRTHLARDRYDLIVHYGKVW